MQLITLENQIRRVRPAFLQCRIRSVCYAQNELDDIYRLYEVYGIHCHSLSGPSQYL
jgi:hypothetical protein